MDDGVPLVLTPMPKKPWKVDKAVLQNGDAQEAKVAVALRTNRTLAINIHGEASTTLRRFHLLINRHSRLQSTLSIRLNWQLHLAIDP